MPITFQHLVRSAAVAAGAVALAIALAQPASSAPFANLPGKWSGTGKIRVKGQDTERLRCSADYQPRGSSGNTIVLRLSCDSDSYKFDLTGNFEADSNNGISGRWTESTRNIGGNAIGRVSGDAFQLHVESSAFAANLRMVTRNNRQSVTFDAQGGGQIVDASITLNKGR
jgi:hypothetical protein